MALTVETRPVRAGDLDALGELFGQQRSTRHCWCTLFCQSRGRFALGWYGGGNRRRFEAIAEASTTPMGVLAGVGGESVGWAACGPRARYVAATSEPNLIMTHRDPAEDGTVWLLPCLVVAEAHRQQGVTHELVRAAIEVARDHGATAVEAWPQRQGVGTAAQAFLGREGLFAESGFRVVDRPTPTRVVMRLDLARS